MPRYLPLEVGRGAFSKVFFKTRVLQVKSCVKLIDMSLLYQKVVCKKVVLDCSKSYESSVLDF